MDAQNAQRQYLSRSLKQCHQSMPNTKTKQWNGQTSKGRLALSLIAPTARFPLSAPSIPVARSCLALLLGSAAVKGECESVPHWGSCSHRSVLEWKLRTFWQAFSSRIPTEIPILTYANKKSAFETKEANTIQFSAALASARQPFKKVLRLSKVV